MLPMHLKKITWRKQEKKIERSVEKYVREMHLCLLKMRMYKKWKKHCNNKKAITVKKKTETNIYISQLFKEFVNIRKDRMYKCKAYG